MGCVPSQPVGEPTEADPRRWGRAEVAQWLSSLGLSKYRRHFKSVDGQTLLEVTAAQLSLRVEDAWDLMCLEGALRQLRSKLPPDEAATEGKARFPPPPPSSSAAPQAASSSPSSRHSASAQTPALRNGDAAPGSGALDAVLAVHPRQWTSAQVRLWLAGIGMGSYCETFGAVSGRVLLRLNEAAMNTRIPNAFDLICFQEALADLREMWAAPVEGKEPGTGQLSAESRRQSLRLDSPQPLQGEPALWSRQQVGAWLAQQGLERHAEALKAVTGTVLLQMTEEMVREKVCDPVDAMCLWDGLKRLKAETGITQVHRQVSVWLDEVEQPPSAASGPLMQPEGEADLRRRRSAASADPSDILLGMPGWRWATTPSEQSRDGEQPGGGGGSEAAPASRQSTNGAPTCSAAEGTTLPHANNSKAAKHQAALAALLCAAGARGATPCGAPPPQAAATTAKPPVAPPPGQPPCAANHKAAAAALMASLTRAEPPQKAPPPAHHMAALAAVQLAAVSEGRGSPATEAPLEEDTEGEDSDISTDAGGADGPPSEAMAAAVLHRLGGGPPEAALYFPSALAPALRDWWEAEFGAQDASWEAFRGPATAVMADAATGDSQAAALHQPELLVDEEWAEALGLEPAQPIDPSRAVTAAHLLHFQLRCEDWVAGELGQSRPVSLGDHLRLLLAAPRRRVQDAWEAMDAEALAAKLGSGGTPERWALLMAALPECLEWLLRKYDGWLASGTHRVLALSAAPGQGKSALMCALAAARRGSVAVLHRCRSSDAPRNSPRCVLLALIRQLASLLPELCPILLQVLQKQTELSHLTVRHLFEGLLLYPLLQLRAPPREPVVVVLDGLDHCDGGSREDGPSVPELLPRWLAYLPPWLRFVVTFAPGSPAEAALAGQELRRVRLSSGRCRRAIAGAATAALARQGALTLPACEAAGAALASAARGSLAYGAAKLADVARMATSLPEEAVLREVSQLPRGQAALLREALRCVCAAGVVHPGGAAAERLLPVLAAARQPLPASWLPDIAGCSGPEAQALVAALGGLLVEHEERLLWRDHTLLTVWQEEGALDPITGHRLLEEWCWRQMSAAAPRSCAATAAGELGETAAYILAHSLAHSLALAEAAAGGEAGLGPWPGLPRVAALLGNMAFLQGQYELGRGHTLCREVTQLLAVLPDGSAAEGAARGEVCEVLRFLHASGPALQRSPEALVQEALSCPCGSYPRRQATALLASGDFNTAGMAYWRNAPRRFPAQRMLLQGHAARVLCVAVMPDGVTCVSGSEDKTIRVWDLRSGETLQTLRGHTHSIRALAASSDGQWLASGGQDGAVRVWQLSAGCTVAVLQAEAEWVAALAWLPNGTLAAGTACPPSVLLWEPELSRGTSSLAPSQAKAAARVLKGYGGTVTCLQPLPDGRLASGSADGSIVLWDTTRGRAEAALRGHADAVRGLTLQGRRGEADGTLVSASADGTIRIWETATGSCRAIRAHSSWVNSVHGLSDGRLATCSDDETVRVWSAQGQLQHSLTGHQHYVRSVVAAGAQQLVSCSDDFSVRVWDVPDADADGEVARGHAAPVHAVAVLPDGRLATAGGDRSVLLWSAEGELDMELAMPEVSSRVMALLPVGADRLAVASHRRICVWNHVTGERTAVLLGHQAMVHCMAMLPDGRLLSGSADEDMRLWDVDSGECCRTLKGQVSLPNVRNYWRDHIVRSVAVLPGWGRGGGLAVASGASDKTIRLWDPDSGCITRVLSGHYGAILALALVGDDLLLSGSEDQTIRVWSRSAPVALRVLEGHMGAVTCLAVTPDATCVVSGSDDRTVRVFDTATWEEVNVLRGHSAEVQSLAATADGRVVSGAAETCVFLWTLQVPMPSCLQTAPSMAKFVNLAPSKWVTGGQEELEDSCI